MILLNYSDPKEIFLRLNWSSSTYNYLTKIWKKSEPFRSEEGLTLETSAFKHFTVVYLHYLLDRTVGANSVLLLQSIIARRISDLP